MNIGLLDLVIAGAASFLIGRIVQHHGLQFADIGSRRWRATTPIARLPAEVRAPEGASNLRSAIVDTRKSDRDFHPEGVERAAAECFRLVHTALVMRDAGNIRTRLTPEMYFVLRAQAGDLKAARRFRHVERLEIDSAQVSELWQERGQDFATVHIVSRSVDYTTDGAGAVVLGSKTTLTRVEQWWTFTRPMGPYAWTLAAIEQR